MTEPLIDVLARKLSARTRPLAIPAALAWLIGPRDVAARQQCGPSGCPPTPTPTPTATPTATPTMTPTPPPAAPRLTTLGAYQLFAVNDETPNHLLYKEMRYVPRGFTPGELPYPGSGQILVNDGGYGGFDVLATKSTASNKHQIDNALKIDLTRPARVGVIWLSDYNRAGWSYSPMTLPNWLSGYTQGEDVLFSWPRAENDPQGAHVNIAARTFWTDADDLWQGGGIVNPGQTLTTARLGYWVLLAERQADGSAVASEPPTYPEGQEAPRAGDRCPDWIHDQTLGADGFYRWHEQIHPAYWCYYGHDHGADPRGLVDIPLGAIGIQHGMAEDHPSQKVSRWVVPPHNGLPKTTIVTVVHQGSHSGIGAVCVRYHEVHFYLFANDTGENLVSFRFMGDFGRAVAASNGQWIYAEACPNQAQAVSDEGYFVTGKRQFPTHDLQPNGGYYPWSLELRRVVLGIFGNFVHNTFDPITILTAPGQPGGPWAQNYPADPADRTSSGTGVFIQAGGWSLAPDWTGTRYSDPFGRAWLDASDPMAVAQYVSPRMAGKAWVNPFNKCSGPGFGKAYDCVYSALDKHPPTERENSIPNGGPN